MKSTLHFAFAICLAFILSACSNASGPSGTPTIKAGVGSTFTYHATSTNAAGTTVADSMTTYTIISETAAVGGKTNVHVAANGAKDTVYFNYLGRGVEYYQPAVTVIGDLAISAAWVSLDSADHTSKTILNIRDTVNQGVVLYFHLTEIQTRIPDTTVTINGKSYLAIRWTIHFVVTSEVAATGSMTTTIVDYTPSFARELGYFTSQVLTTNSDAPFSPIPNGVEVKTLQSATLK